MWDESAFVVEKMLDYLYTGDYSEAPSDKLQKKLGNSTIYGFQLHAQLFTIGDKYCIPLLCEIATTKYFDKAQNPFNSSDYFESIPDIFFSPLNHNNTLKMLAARIMKDTVGSHLNNPLVRSKYDDVAAQSPGFVKEVLDICLTSHILTWTCDNCDHFDTGKIRMDCGNRGKKKLYPFSKYKVSWSSRS
ncbi:hypothetical protein N7456_004660 [Penicillium angulare]|uniref:BTB domain-containing protein n=1 Tax=Penicillium angulare TaxID=116970 RepID=A0A9W9KIT3_9EURO|nr:hypothetical protein N7456_004660 [Penicillium angulare]